ncbi:MAG TPA: AI-2E family transporter [Thermoanaerobaculia bacterium]|nr:AI-2E family transporter [Thermoanaerobaculia bacterium]
MERYILKIEKWLIWGGLIGVLVLLRHFFPVIFFTFVLSYIGQSAVKFLSLYFPHRKIVLSTVAVLFLLALSGVGLLVVPRLFSETRNLAVHYIELEEERADANARIVARPDAGLAPLGDDSPLIQREIRKYVDSLILRSVGRDALDSFRDSDSYEILLERVEGSVTAFIPRIVEGVRQFVNHFFSVAFQFLLSILFSFLILWDLPRLRISVQRFAFGRTAEIYREIAPGMRALGLFLGRAFEAQSLIAVVNALLTSIGFLILGIPSIALLGTIVFFCSYIPIFGMVLSTLPAALLALKIGGLGKVGWLILVILVVHAVEAYGLNPMIYGRHMKMHPIGVLVILLIGEHLFGIWGLLLGVPVAAFFLDYVIRGEIPEPRSVPSERGEPAAAAAVEPGT